MSEMFTLEEAAPQLRLSVHTLRHSKEWQEKLGAVKVGRKWLVPGEAINEVLTGKR